MKKSVVILGGIGLAVVVIGGAYFALSSGTSKGSIAAYWDKNLDINQAADDGELPLIKAINAGDIEAVKKLLENGAKPMSANANKISALEAALIKGDADIFYALQEKEQNVLRQPKYLKAAIEGGNVQLVKQILDNGAKANATLEITGRYRPDEELDYTDPRVITPLRKALEENKVDIVKLLLERGAKGDTFFFAKELLKGNMPMVKVMADKIGNLRPLAVKGTDILTAAITEAKPEMIEFLLERNAGDINAALLKFVLSRKNDNPDEYLKIFEIFLKNGAMPTPEMLQIILKKGRTEQFVKLAGCLKNPNMKLEGDDDNLFLYAMRNNHVEAATFLLEHGADIWLLGHDSKSAMELAVEQMKDKADLYKAFKSKLKNVNDAGYLGESLLMLLAKNAQYDEFQKVVNEGGDIWQKDHNGKTVLMYAAEGGNLDIIHYLMKKGDNVEVTDRNGKTPLMYAAEAGKLEAVNDLINKGAVTSDVDDMNKSVIMYAAAGGHADVVNALLDEGESAYAMDKNRKNVLMYAMESGDMKTINALARKGMDPLALDKDSRSVLLYAAKGGSVEAVDMLLKNHADIYVADKYGYLPLTWALKKGNKEIFSKVSGRLDIMSSTTADDGRSLALHAIDGGNIDLIRWAVNSLRDLYNIKDKKGQNFVMLIAKDGRPDMLRDVLRREANTSTSDNDGKSVMMYAAEGENAVNLITLLQNSSVNVNREMVISSRDRQERTVLMYAVGGKYNQIIKMQRLLQHGASATAADKQGKTVLMYTVGNSQARVDNQMVRELLYKGAKVDSVDVNDKTVLMYAAENSQLDVSVLETLIDAGAKVNVADKQGKTVLMYAVAGGNISKVRLLLEKGARNLGKTTDGKSVQDFADEIGSCYAEAVRAVLNGK